MNAIAQAWHARSRSERRILGIAGAAAAILLVVGLVWLPLDRLRTRLAAEAPGLRASIDALQRDADEVKRLRALPAAGTGTAGAAASPLATLATNGGGLTGSQMVVLDDKRVRLTGADVSFAALLEWLRNAQATHGMRVDSARLDALPAPGRVRAEMVLSRS